MTNEGRKIPISTRNFDDYRKSILNITKQYYPDVYDNLNDASIGSWFIDVFSDVADSLSYHIDKTRTETNIETSQSHKSIMNMAKDKGVNIPGPKSAICEVELSCRIPLNNQGPVADNNLAQADENYAPRILKGTLFSSGMNTFELIEDVDFSKQFNLDGYPNRQIIPNKNANGVIESYTYKKLALCQSGRTKVYRKVLTEENIHPFMEITINDNNITSIESVIVKDGSNLSYEPSISDFLIETVNKNRTIERFHQVGSLIEQSYFGLEENYLSNKPSTEAIHDIISFLDNSNNLQHYATEGRMVSKGKWKPLKNKFVVEHLDHNNVKLIFGAGRNNTDRTIPEDAKKFNQHIMSRMLANDYLGVLPKANSTIYVQYRVGGGEITNVAKDTITIIQDLKSSISGNCNDDKDVTKKSNVLRSISVTNTSPSYGGKDMLSTEELKMYIKYKSNSGGRCVTLKDYVERVMDMPSKFGVPFRVNAIEENNKICLYTLGLNYMGHLISEIPILVSNNILEYISNYKMINDLVEVRSGKVVNLKVEVNIIAGKMYDPSTVSSEVMKIVKEHFNIDNHVMGQDIYIGDLERKISNVDGVLNLISVNIYNPINGAYSNNPIRQQLDTYSLTKNQADEVEIGFDEYNSERKVDLSASDKVIYCDADTMCEVRYDKDIVINIKQR